MSYQRGSNIPPHRRDTPGGGKKGNTFDLVLGILCDLVALVVWVVVIIRAQTVFDYGHTPEFYILAFAGSLLGIVSIYLISEGLRSD